MFSERKTPSVKWKPYNIDLEHTNKVFSAPQPVTFQIARQYEPMEIKPEATIHELVQAVSCEHIQTLLAKIWDILGGKAITGEKLERSDEYQGHDSRHSYKSHVINEGQVLGIIHETCIALRGSVE